MLNSLAKLVAKTVHENSRGRSSCYENECVKWVKRSKKKPTKKSKEKGESFLLHQNHLSLISLGQAFYRIWHKVTSLYDRFMETLTSQCFGECDRFTSFVQCSRSARNVNTLLETLLNLSFFGYPKKIFTESRILFHSLPYFFFHQLNSMISLIQEQINDILKNLTRFC